MIEARPGTPGYIWDNINLVHEVLEKKRTEPDGVKKWEWLDFLEINVLTWLSVFAEWVFNGENPDELPKPAPIEWKNPKFESEYYKLWLGFLEPTSKSAMKSKLDRMYLLWRNHSNGFETIFE